VESFIINSNGTLSAVQDLASTGGNGPAFAVALSTGQVAAMNYGSGNGVVIPTEGSGLTFNNNSPAPVITFPVNPGTLSHPHMVLEHGSEILIPDLVSATPHFRDNA
jgi:hypothetical protein